MGGEVAQPLGGGVRQFELVFHVAVVLLFAELPGLYVPVGCVLRPVAGQELLGGFLFLAGSSLGGAWRGFLLFFVFWRGPHLCLLPE